MIFACAHMIQKAQQNMEEEEYQLFLLFQDGEMDNVTAEFVHSTLVRCPFSGDGEIEVAVSNNGATLSNFLSYVCYDSVCDNCTETPCTIRVILEFILKLFIGISSILNIFSQVFILFFTHFISVWFVFSD